MFGGPGSGKSTMAASVFAELKWLGIDCEYVSEYAKDKVWEESYHVLNCQPLVLGKQLSRIFRLNGKVEVVVTDSPILLSPIYDKYRSKAFLAHVVEQFSMYNNYNIFLKRVKKYNPNGRMQTLSEAEKLDLRIREMLICTDTPFVLYNGERKSVSKIVGDIKRIIG